MSRVCRFPSAWFATLVLAGAGLNELPLVWAAENWAAETSAANRQAAVMETFAKPDGQTYFALKLVPQMAQPAEMPHDIVVLFDTSASQTGAYRAKAAGAVRAMLAALSPSDRVALLAVDVNVARLTPSLVAPKGSAVTQALTALDRRVPLGSTDLSLGLESALSILTDSNNTARARSVVYIGDGLSGSNLLSMDGVHRVIAEYVDKRVACSSYVIGPAVNGLLLAALANHTGGMLVADDARMTAGQAGSYLASVADGSVIWPTSVNLPESIKNAYPRPMPPLRFDRDSVVVGSVDPTALESNKPLAVAVQAEIGGQKVNMKWNVAPQTPQPENAYLAKVVEFAAPSDGIGLPTAGSAGLNELRHWSNFGAQQLARLGKGAFALGQTDAAAQLATQAEELDPDNAEAATVRAAAVRSKQPVPNRQPTPSRQPTGGELRLARAQAEPMPEIATDADLPDAGDGELLESVERNQRVVEGFLRSEVNNALNQARATMGVDPEGTRDRLKLLLDKVQHTAELEPELRGQFIDKIEAALRETGRMVMLLTEKNLQQQVIRAEGEARERINRELFLQEEKVDQLMSRFDALMDEERYRDAEALADIAEEIEPGRPGLRGAELTARMVGYTADIMAVLDLRRKGFVDATYQIELSHVPTPDEPPILYPDPEVWQLLTERRKKYKAVDLTQHGPTETAILAALDEKTDLDFSDQPLADVVEYLKQRHGIEIQLDSKALSDAGVATDTPVTRNIRGITLRSALKLLLSEYDLTYVIANEVLMITSKTEAENKLSTRVYPVGDLVIPTASAMGGGRGMFNVADDEAGQPTAKAPRLRAQLVKDDLKVTKKGAKPQQAAAPEAKARGAKPAAAKENVPNVGRPDQGAVDAPPVVRRRGEKIEPIQIEFKDGDDIDMKWNDYFAAHTADEAPSEAVVRETVRQLRKAKKFDHVIGCIYAALRNQQGQPWMYEVLCLAMQADERPSEEIERVLLSALDFATNPLEVMYLAQYMARSGLDKRALQLYRQVSMMLPAAPQPYVAGLQLAQKLDDLEGIQWATLGILGQPWPSQQIKVWETGWNVAEATLARLKSENRKEEADAYRNAVNEALRRDLVVVVSWTGDADVDLLVEEPAGSVCSYRVPYTLSGGIMLGDSAGRSKTDEIKAQGSQEAYVCPKAFNGEYRVMVRRVWGKVTNDKVTVDVFWHYWSKKERTMRKQIDVSGGDAVCLVNLEEGRRTEPLEQQQVLNAVANQLGASMMFTGVQQMQAANELDAARQATQQMNAQNDLAVTGSMARSRARQVGEIPRGLNPINPFFVRGATGYQPVISTLPQGGSMFTTAVVSADRRYVRISPIPFFSVVSEVNTFNFVTGAGGSSAGGGAGGFGGGGGAGGLGGFGGGRGGGGGGGI